MTNEVLNLRPLQISDQHTLLQWLSNPTLLEFYAGRDANYTEDKIMTDFFPANDTHFRFIVEYNDKPIGYVQYYAVDEEELKEYGHKENNIYGMDQFIGETVLWNQGLGSLLVKAVLERLFSLGAKIVVMDPHVKNKRSIKCYEKCGFTIVKLLPKHELHEGILEDCYLMEFHINNN